MNAETLIVSLLGGGVLTQIVTAVLHARQNARQLNANALGTEVQALERTISLLKENLEAEIKRHDREREQLMGRITQLEEQAEKMRATLKQLHMENVRLSAEMEAVRP